MPAIADEMDLSTHRPAAVGVRLTYAALQIPAAGLPLTIRPRALYPLCLALWSLATVSAASSRFAAAYRAAAARRDLRGAHRIRSSTASGDGGS